MTRIALTGGAYQARSVIAAAQYCAMTAERVLSVISSKGGDSVRFIDLTGQRFNRVLVLGRGGYKGPVIAWHCRCDCGNEWNVAGYQLKSGNTKSCGCWSRDRAKAELTRHGMTGHNLHSKWKGLLSRCLNPNGASFKNYGGRGIAVCERWMTFENFRDDMGPSFQEGLTIDRINVDGDYEPKNCKWVPRSEQSKNRRPSLNWAFKSEGISRNTSGYRGVSPDPQGNGWVAAICIRRKQIRLGRFDTKEEAAAAYLSAAKRRQS